MFAQRPLDRSSNMKGRHGNPRAPFSPWILDEIHNLSIFDFDIIARNILTSPADSHTFRYIIHLEMCKDKYY